MSVMRLRWLPLGLRLLLSEIGDSLRFWLQVRRERRTGRAAVDSGDWILPRFRWWRLPLCWVRGHRWPADSTGFWISPYRMEHCACCGEEVSGRASIASLQPLPESERGWSWGDE